MAFQGLECSKKGKACALDFFEGWTKIFEYADVLNDTLVSIPLYDDYNKYISIHMNTNENKSQYVSGHAKKRRKGG